MSDRHMQHAADERSISGWDACDWDELVVEAEGLLEELFPICRSITGNGVRQTLRRLSDVSPIEVVEVPSGTVCYDWTVPDEWNISEAFIEDDSGRRIVDFEDSNLHVLNYSTPIDAQMTFPELEPHLHYLPNMPQAVPYRTTYYKREWGFCLSHEQFERMDRDATYRVCIRSALTKGSLSYGVAMNAGNSGREFMVSTYCCHPSLANDNLSGLVLWALLLREVRKRSTRHTYRFVVVPETIGAITYLSQHEESMSSVEGCLIPTTVAGPGRFGYKESFQGDHLIDRAVRAAFKASSTDFTAYPFDINGSDESHYSAPFFRIPCGTISKDKYFEYDYYHTSLDDLDFISAKSLVETLGLYMKTLEVLELDVTFRSLNPYSEAMLSKRDLYPSLGGSIRQKAAIGEAPSDANYRLAGDRSVQGNELDAIGWLMFLSDGSNSLLDVSERTGLPVRQLHDVGRRLEAHGLLEEI